MSRYSDEREVVFSLQGINAETEKVASTQDDMLSRKPGDGPNMMETDLDMNSYRILNLPEAINNTEPLRKVDGDIILEEATSQADRAESEADRAELQAGIATDAAGNAAEQAVSNVQSILESLRDDTQTARNEAVEAADDSEQFRDSARDSALQLEELLDAQGVILEFPLDLGFITETPPVASYDLGGL